MHIEPFTLRGAFLLALRSVSANVQWDFTTRFYPREAIPLRTGSVEYPAPSALP